jgi:hypothetical protein
MPNPHHSFRAKNGHHLRNSHSFRPKKMAITYATAIPSVPKKMAITYATATLSAQKKWPSLSRQPLLPSKKNGRHLRNSHSFRAKKWPSLSRQPLLPLKKNGHHFRDSHFFFSGYPGFRFY